MQNMQMNKNVLRGQKCVIIKEIHVKAKKRIKKVYPVY